MPEVSISEFLKLWSRKDLERLSATAVICGAEGKPWGSPDIQQAIGQVMRDRLSDSN